MLMNWSHQWFGFWQEDGRYANAPSVADWLQPGWWESRNRQGALDYLDQGVTLRAVGSQDHVCHLCQKALPRTLAICSDGVWAWNHYLLHYIQEHGSRLPSAFYDHMEVNNFKAVVPPVDDPFDAVRNLDWTMFADGFSSLGIKAEDYQ